MKEKFLYIGFLGLFILSFLSTNTLALDANEGDASISSPARRQPTANPPSGSASDLAATAAAASAPAAYVPIQDALLAAPPPADQSAGARSPAAPVSALTGTHATKRLSISQTVGSPHPTGSPLAAAVMDTRPPATSVASLPDALLVGSAPSAGASAAGIALTTIPVGMSSPASATTSSSSATAVATPTSAPTVASSDVMSRDDPPSADSVLFHSTDLYRVKPPSYKRPVCNFLCCSICKGCSWFNPKISWLECFFCLPKNDQVDRNQRCCDTCSICLCSRCPECTCCKSSGSHGNGSTVPNPYDSSASYASLPGNG